MSTSAVFLIGKGQGAKQLGSQSHDGGPNTRERPGHIPRNILLAKTEEEYRKAVIAHLVEEETREVVEFNNDVWREVQGYSYIYSFFNGHVWITDGGRWFNPLIKAEPPRTPPAAPVGRKGLISGEMRVVCGECYYHVKVDSERLVKKFGKEWNADHVKMFFESKGFRYTRAQGWLCSECLPTSPK